MGDLAVKDGESLLFIGDSITDCGRRVENAPLGDGYVSLLSELVTAQYPQKKIRIINKGIGGNRVTDLADRWEDDMIRYQPD